MHDQKQTFALHSRRKTNSSRFGPVLDMFDMLELLPIERGFLGLFLEGNHTIIQTI